MHDGNLRRHERSDARVMVTIMWKDRAGAEKFTNAFTLNVSEAGMKVEVPEALTERSYVVIRADKLGIHGTASVRSCARQGTHFVAGLEFSAGLKFKPKTPKAAPPKSTP